MELKLASYNIHACIGTDGHFDPFRIVDVIREMDADIIALQEVEHHMVNDIDLLDFIAQQTGMIGIAGPTMFRESRHYGNAVLSKYPLTSHELIDLSLEPHEPRGAIQINLTIEQHQLVIMTTHFGLKPAERQYQVEKLLSRLPQHEVDTAVLMGDLNEWFIWGSTLRRLKAYFDTTPAKKSFPSFFPIFALDRIWVHPRQHLLSLDVHKTALAKKASDHLPVVARILF
ncbi:endonuclease/exonuclease/phosphatase family protein [Methylophaga sulfidovorans]|uniref:Metal-dependent hydrolase, endonuclease/exonuclease/phosphatase family n=1 Tax=Methylophaga sulfidovorans TaxID=45496 RepID=A0A1I4BKS5_9GAMM|nr:endonuclease/exonuclease/phosphatase family protein [Methylophaga sulfidovorans]SFK68817.1 Metal-dependent hydrolase, endonuclease/exonuclease/phosphatase family [Methylophaga sulfidovorans]